MQSHLALKIRLPKYSLLTIVLLIISWLTLSPKPFANIKIHFFVGEDKVAHVLLFILLTIVWIWERRHEKLQKMLSPWIPLYSIIIGGIIELMQWKIIDGRSGDIYDWLTDCFGVLIGIIAVLFRLRKKI